MVQELRRSNPVQGCFVRARVAAVNELDGGERPRGPSTVRLTLDGRVLAFSAGVAVASVLIFGLAPARGSRLFPLDALREAGRGTACAATGWPWCC